MEVTAQRLAMSVATLRRRLEEEHATFSGIVDELRRQLAEGYLRDDQPTVSEVAFLLGFSDVAAFGRAFKRWHGISPTEFRAGERN
jgi:AraC-like DNA-binding protein